MRHQSTITRTYTVDGQRHHASHQDSDTIYDQNNADNSCSAIVTKQQLNEPLKSVASNNALVMLLLLAASALYHL